MNKDVLRQFIVIVSFVLTLTVNGLANALPINGMGTGEISDMFQVFFVPAGYVFAIWGLIYLALLGFTVYHSLPAQRENARLRQVGYWFALGNLANAVWIFLWHYLLIPVSLLAMLTLLASLIVIFLRLEIGQRPAPNLAEKWLVNFPFSLYLGWITVATIANVTDALYVLNWNGFGIAPEVWAVIMLVVATGVAALMAFTRGDVTYLAVLVWAFAGIGVKQAGAPLVATSAWIAAGAVTALAAAGWLRMRRAA